MSYELNITDRAQRDIEDALWYISYHLKNPQAADALLDEIESALSGLTEMPERYALAQDDILASWGIRFVTIKRYLAFYVADRATSTVHIVRFLYGRSNWAALLHQDMPTEL